MKVFVIHILLVIGFVKGDIINRTTWTDEEPTSPSDALPSQEASSASSSSAGAISTTSSYSSSTASPISPKEQRKNECKAAHRNMANVTVQLSEHGCQSACVQIVKRWEYNPDTEAVTQVEDIRMIDPPHRMPNGLKCGKGFGKECLSGKCVSSLWVQDCKGKITDSPLWQVDQDDCSTTCRGWDRREIKVPRNEGQFCGPNHTCQDGDCEEVLEEESQIAT